MPAETKLPTSKCPEVPEKQVTAGRGEQGEQIDNCQAISSQSRPHLSTCTHHPPPNSRRARSGSTAKSPGSPAWKHRELWSAAEAAEGNLDNRRDELSECLSLQLSHLLRGGRFGVRSGIRFRRQAPLISRLPIQPVCTSLCA